jgi:hypothetical protein
MRDLFPGPRPFSEDEEDLFHGRRRETDELRALLRAYRTVLLHAQSGAGKTSLVRAGLLPALKAEGTGWIVSRVGAMAARNAPAAGDSNVFADVLIGGLSEQVGRARTIRDAFSFLSGDTEFVLVLDQFEEVFTNYPDCWAHREPFFEQLAGMLRVKPRLRLLFVIREEYVARLEAFAHFFPEEFQIRFFLEKLRASQAREAVTEPLKSAGVEFESGEILDALIENLRRQKLQRFPGGGRAGETPEVVEYVGEFVEPVQLQVVCRTLAAGLASAGIRRIGMDELKLYGDPETSLIRFYEDALNEVARSEHVRAATLRRWFESALITPAGTRGTAFMGQAETEGLRNSAVQRLAEAHLVRSEQRAGGAWYELTHDRLLDPIRQSNSLWRARRNRKLRWAGAGLGAGFLLLLLAAFAVVSGRHRQDLIAQTKVLEDVRKESRQKTTQAAVAEALAQFLAVFDADPQAAGANLEKVVRSVWAKEPLETILSVDRILGVFPAPEEDEMAWPKSSDYVRQLRCNLLAGLNGNTPNLDALHGYVCSHNAAVVVASCGVNEHGQAVNGDWEMKTWQRRGFSGVFLGTANSLEKGLVPVIADRFLSCEEAARLLKKLDAKFPEKRAYLISCYTGCAACQERQPLQNRYSLYPFPSPHQ